MSDGRVAIGMDMGGTNLRLGVVDAEGRVLHSTRRPLGTDRSVKTVEEIIVGEIDALGAWCCERGLDPLCACLAAPGIIAHEEGVIVFSPNLPGWRDVPLRDLVAGRTGLPATLENDANAAAFGESWRGGGRGARHLVMLTLGTGVGGGIVADGRVIRGARGMAGELGHLTVVAEGRPCQCGNRGCLEVYASATAVVARLAESWDGPGTAPATARVAAELAADGDERCRRIFDEAGYHLGVAMADVVNVLNPEVIIVGGGVTDAWELFMPRAEAEMRSRAFRFTDLAEKVAVRRAELGEQAGVVGAAGIFWSGWTA